MGLSTINPDTQYNIFLQLDSLCDVQVLASACRSLRAVFQAHENLILDRVARNQFGDAYLPAKKLLKIAENTLLTRKDVLKLRQLHMTALKMSTKYVYLMKPENYKHYEDRKEKKIKKWFAGKPTATDKQVPHLPNYSRLTFGDRLTPTEFERFLPALVNFMLYCQIPYTFNDEGKMFLKSIYSLSPAQFLYVDSIFEFCWEIARYYSVCRGGGADGDDAFRDRLCGYIMYGPEKLIKVWDKLAAKKRLNRDDILDKDPEGYEDTNSEGFFLYDFMDVLEEGGHSGSFDDYIFDGMQGIMIEFLNKKQQNSQT